MKINTCGRGRHGVKNEFSTENPHDQRVNPGSGAICKRPGCGKPLPVNKGRGRTRQFCSDECARRYHNAARGPTPRAEPPGTENPLAALDALVRQAVVLVRAALEQAASADPAEARAQVAEAEAARLRAEALAAAATARAAEAQRQVEALTEALTAAREEALAARAELERAQSRHGGLTRGNPGHLAVLIRQNPKRGAWQFPFAPGFGSD